ncbi:MAG: hypothetical protein ACR2I2_12345, partial [Bryobacteraceae bacterium]
HTSVDTAGTSARATNQEAGFAMLLLFAMAAIIAITLYNALPRVAFEAQRDQEELLVERGEQYKRAIQLYYRKTKRYPAKMEDLENTNGVRFLRRKYVDPMTGKSDWRLLHIGAGGQLTDSLIKKKDPNKKEESVNTFITELPALGAGPQQGGPPNLAMRRRPSEAAPGTVDASGMPIGIPAGAQPGMPVQPGQYPNQYPQGQFGTQPGIQTGPPGAPQYGGGIAGMNTTDPNQPGLPVNSQTGGVSPTPYPTPYSTQPGAQGSTTPPFPQPGLQPSQPGQNAAADVIRNLLTTPRPGGLPGAQIGTGNVGGLQIGGGIAGVASTAEREGIKIYNEQTEYNKWEFVYDFSKDRANGPVVGVAAPGANQPGLNGPGLNGPGLTGPGFGQTASPSSPTSTSPTGTPAPGPAPFIGGPVPATPNDGYRQPGVPVPGGYPQPNPQQPPLPGYPNPQPSPPPPPPTPPRP